MDWRSKTVLLIGATGSFGTNFLETLISKNPKTIRIYSRDEHKQSIMLNNYGGVGRRNNLSGFIGDIRDKERLNRAMEGVDIVIHAAALKQVQSCEYNPFEAIKTNILGSQNIAEVALDHDIEKVVGISTDKAVNPLNLYGATKMCMEKVFIHANNYRGKNGKTLFCCTRYGNVASSRGTVIHIWREQIRKGQPLAVTNFNATRFWIEMRSANRFVAKCVEYMDNSSGGEIYIPKMPSVRVKDLYHAIISGDDRYASGEVLPSVIGDRVGDKVHETLISKDEVSHTVDLGDEFIICPESPQWEYKAPKGEVCGYSDGYTSANNKEFLSIEDIKKTLEGVV